MCVGVKVVVDRSLVDYRVERFSSDVAEVQGRVRLFINLSNHSPKTHQSEHTFTTHRHCTVALLTNYYTTLLKLLVNVHNKYYKNTGSQSSFNPCPPCKISIFPWSVSD